MHLQTSVRNPSFLPTLNQQVKEMTAISILGLIILHALVASSVTAPTRQQRTFEIGTGKQSLVFSPTYEGKGKVQLNFPSDISRNLNNFNRRNQALAPNVDLRNFGNFDRWNQEPPTIPVLRNLASRILGPNGNNALPAALQSPQVIEEAMAQLQLYMRDHPAFFDHLLSAMEE